MLNNSVIKIKNKEPFIYIEKRLNINNLFLTKKKDNIIVSYGSYIICDSNQNIINNLFSNSNNFIDVQKYYKFNKVKIMYWTSVFT